MKHYIMKILHDLHSNEEMRRNSLFNIQHYYEMLDEIF